MLRLSVALGTDEWVFGFPQDDVIVGSARTNGLVLAHDMVADRQVRFTLQPDQRIFMTVLDRTHRMRLNGLDAPVDCHVGEEDVITIGPYRLGLLLRDPAGAAEQAFLDAIARSPEDDGSRAVYSDWLEEHGQADEARFLRAQIELRGIPDAASPRFQALTRLVKEMAPRMSLDWRRAIARPYIENCNLQMEVRCPKNWDDLSRTARPDERFCGTCQRSVTYVTDLSKAQRLARQGECLVVDLTVHRFPNDLAPPPPLESLGPIPLPGVYLPPPGWPGRLDD